MKTKTNHSAFNDTKDEYGNMRAFNDLTKREYFAAIALQGLLANIHVTTGTSFEEIAESACYAADNLIIRLNKIKGDVK